MGIYVNKKNNKTYTIEVLKSPKPFLDGNTRLGVYAYPYYWTGEVMFFKSTDFDGACKTWVEDNFRKIADN